MHYKVKYFIMFALSNVCNCLYTAFFVSLLCHLISVISSAQDPAWSICNHLSNADQFNVYVYPGAIVEEQMVLGSSMPTNHKPVCVGQKHAGIKKNVESGYSIPWTCSDPIQC